MDSHIMMWFMAVICGSWHLYAPAGKVPEMPTDSSEHYPFVDFVDLLWNLQNAFNFLKYSIPPPRSITKKRPLDCC